MQNRECIVFEQIRDTEQRIHEPWRVCESRVYPVFSQLSGGFICIIRLWMSYSAAKKNNNTAKFIVSLKQNNSEGFIGAP